jgi:hypothetical protein
MDVTRDTALRSAARLWTLRRALGIVGCVVTLGLILAARTTVRAARPLTTGLVDIQGDWGFDRAVRANAGIAETTFWGRGMALRGAGSPAGPGLH